MYWEPRTLNWICRKKPIMITNDDDYNNDGDNSEFKQSFQGL